MEYTQKWEHSVAEIDAHEQYFPNIEEHEQEGWELITAAYWNGVIHLFYKRPME
jgi:hypothetical protein